MSEPRFQFSKADICDAAAVDRGNDARKVASDIDASQDGSIA
jgi:hypothetical protein